MEQPEVVAAFDFDGTLSSRDNFVPFLRRAAGTGPAAEAFVLSAARLGVAGRSQWSRNQLKARVLERLFAGRDAAEVDAVALAFADEVLARHLREEAVQRADWHRTQGHRLVIVSASFGAYLRPIGERLRFDAVLATELEVRARRPPHRSHGGRERARAGEGASARRVARWRDAVRVGLRGQLR